MTDHKFMPTACPHCGADAGRYDFGAINLGGRYEGRSQWPCGFNYELKFEDIAGLDAEDNPIVLREQKEIVHSECRRKP